MVCKQVWREGHVGHANMPVQNKVSSGGFISNYATIDPAESEEKSFKNGDGRTVGR